jgi:hypothetical protein
VTDWNIVHPDRSWLRAELSVNGLSLHLDAIEVKCDGGVQNGVGALGSTLTVLHEAVAADGPWQTVVIDGREYTLIATPFC